MAAVIYANNNDTLLNNLSWYSKRNDIASMNYHPEGGWLLLNSNNRMRSSRISDSCKNRIKSLRDAGEEIRCVAFAPTPRNATRDTWVIVTDRRSVCNLIPRECIRKLNEFRANGHEVLWVAFPPEGGNRWSIITDRSFFNRNVPAEFDEKMREFHQAGNPAVCAAFNSRGGNSWTIIRKRGFFNRNSPPNCHKTMLHLHALGFQASKIAFGPSLNQWTVISNGHARRTDFLPSKDGFMFNNGQMPMNLVNALKADLPRSGSVAGGILKGLSNAVSHIPFVGNAISDAIDPDQLTANMTFCGGMCQAAKDHYLFGLNLTQTTTKPNDPDGLLTQYLYERQIATLGRLPQMRWAHEFFIRTQKTREVLYRESLSEWSDLKRRLDFPGGRLVMLGLIYTDSEKLWDNHQVLAYGYDVPMTNEVDIKIYDPNRNKDDNHKIRLSIPFRGVGRITQTGRATSRNIKGFFVMEPNSKNPMKPPRIHSTFPKEGIPG